jgi:hypothetical protein
MTTPRTQKVGAILLTCVLAVACDGPTRPTPIPPQPSPPPITNPTREFTLSGTVFEATASGLTPLVGVGIDVSPDYQSHSPRIFSDAEGRYQVSVTSQTVKLVGEKEGYGQPCRVTIAPQADSVVNLYLVSNATLSTTGVPGSMPVLQPTLSGIVYERTPDGNRPLPGASVIGDFSGGLGWGPSARTVSDATGRYLLCGVADSVLGLYLYVQKPGFQRAYLPADCCTGRTFDVELTRE